MIKNTQAMVASVQTSSKGINWIAEDTVAPIQLEVTRTNEPMVITTIARRISGWWIMVPRGSNLTT